ncbi:unnamed protein product, partial [Didymodactylos carnosus]
NEIDGFLLLNDGLDLEMLKELMPPMKYRIIFNNERNKLKVIKQPESIDLNLRTADASDVCTTSVISPKVGHTTLGIHKKSLSYLLQDKNCVYSEPVGLNSFNIEDYEVLRKWATFLCSYMAKEMLGSNALDNCFTTLINEPLDAETVMKEIIQTRSLKSYVIDSLKRYHSLSDLMHILPVCADVRLDNYRGNSKHEIEQFLNIIDTITKSVLLTTTIESMPYESQRYLGNFIKKNDLPLPFAYYTWNKFNNMAEYKINFNLLAETMCSNSERYLLQTGSSSAMGLGKTSILQYIFQDKRSESLNTEGNENLRAGCIDVLFGTTIGHQKNESYVVFDVHGTLNVLNEDIITATQEHCSLQILYVTEQDIDSSFLTSTMNYSNNVRSKPTIVVVFDTDYEDRPTTGDKISDTFRRQYQTQNWPNVTWITAPIFKGSSGIGASTKFKHARRAQSVQQSFHRALGTLETKIHGQRQCTSIFAIQWYYTTVRMSSNVSPPPACCFEIENRLHDLFGGLDGETENLFIVTPISYLDSEIKQCERELQQNLDVSQTELNVKLQDLREQRQRINQISIHTAFFIELLTERSYIELLMTEIFLEKWRSKFESTLHEQLTAAKNEALRYSSKVKQLEEQRSVEVKNSNHSRMENIHNQLQIVQSEFNKRRQLMTEMESKLMNIDLTVGLFCDEIMALYDFLPNLFHTPSSSKNLIQEIAEHLVKLMYKGFAFHILRGRPLRCKSKLIQECLQYLKQTSQPPLVLTVIGEQSSAKSSLLNTTFGCNFRVSAGRCTIGMYMSVVSWKSQPIVIFDTEGLLSLEEAGSIFDNQMVTMAMLSSHLVLINHKGEFSSNLENLIGMSFYAKLQIRAPIKPKLLFVLRDQADMHASPTFFRQLAKLKENLYNDSKFLKSSIEEELEIGDNSVILLPNAFSHDVNAITNLRQCWRNETFPIEIISLRKTIFEKLMHVDQEQAPLTSTSGRSETSTVELVYTDMSHLYLKISSNLDAIDRLGPQLLQCKTLFELSIMNELQTIASEIVQTKNVAMYQEGEQLISQVLSEISTTSCIVNRTQVAEEFVRQLNLNFQRTLDQARAAFASSTERSCYPPDVKQKVERRMEPPIRCTQHLLKDEFYERLHKVLQRTRINEAQKKLMDAAQQEFDQNKAMGLDELQSRLEASFERILKEHYQDLLSSKESENQITEKILKFYNADCQSKAANITKDSIYNLLQPLNNDCYKHYFQKFINCWSELKKQANPADPNILRKFWSFFSGHGDKNVDTIWSDLKHSVEWFSNKKSDKNKKIFVNILKYLIMKIEEEVSNLISNAKSSSSNPRTVHFLFTYVENAINHEIVTNNQKYLNRHELCMDLVVIGLKILIDQAIAVEEANYESNMQKSTKEMKECKENLSKQYNAMKDSFEQGKNLANIVGKQIIDEIGHIVLRKIDSDVKQDIVRSQFINHEAIQNQAYEQSISQANGENILKYVYDINRYFMELSLKEIKTTLNAVTHNHTLNLEQLITAAIDKANETVVADSCEDTEVVKDHVHNAILDILDPQVRYDRLLFDVFPLFEVVRMPIQDSERFKKGFKQNILNYYNDIASRVMELTKNMKSEAFESCKRSISQQLGCQSRCPGCGAKCSRPEPHEKENVEQWCDPCKCPMGKCVCAHPDPILVEAHESTHHIAKAFHGGRYYKIFTPNLELCYQRWTTATVYMGDDDDAVSIFPAAKYYNEKHSAWYNDLNKQSTVGKACAEMVAPPDQRRAWMVVRHTLIKHYSKSHKMIEQKHYNTKLYPRSVVTLPEDYEPTWKDENFEL